MTLAQGLRARSRMRVTNLSAKTGARARNPRVKTRVAPGDDMLLPTDGTLRVYFEIGESALEQIRVGLQAAGAPAPGKILDLPCGYGRVLRYLRAAWPNADIGAMELEADAARFCADAFGARPIFSQNPLWSVDGVDDDYDLLWSGSLLTHFDGADWPPVLSYFRDRLTPGGTLVFTTHGELSIALLAHDPATIATVSAQIGGWTGDYGLGERASGMAASARQTGFAFTHYPGGEDSPFGLSVSTPAWVRRTVAAVDGLQFAHHAPQGWFHHQDVWTFTRTA